MADGRHRTVLVLDALRRGDRRAEVERVAGVADVAAALRHVRSHQTLGVGRRAGVLPDAGAVAVAAVAGLLLRALVVGPAADRLAALVGGGVRLEALQAAALGAVLLGVALRVHSARVGDQAGVDAVALDADLGVGALAVAVAAGRLAADLRVSDGARRAAADGPVVLDGAVGVGAAVARVLAQAVDAGLARRTLVVLRASRRIDQFDGLALAVGLGDVAGATYVEQHGE